MLGHDLFALALLVNLVGRGVADDQKLSTRGARHLRSLRTPDVLAHEQPDSQTLALDHRWLCAGAEVALLIEHFVIRQLALSVVGGDAAAGDQRGRVVNVAAAVFRIADDDGCAADLAADALKPGLEVAAKAAVEQQVLRRVSRQRKLREHPEVVRELRVRMARRVDDALGVPLHITDQKIDLRQGNLQRFAHGRLRCLRAARAARDAALARAFLTARRFFLAAAAFLGRGPGCGARLGRSISRIVLPRSAGDFTVCAPAASSAANFSAAVPLPPATIAPAWPMRLPGGAVTPAI